MRLFNFAALLITFSLLGCTSQAREAVSNEVFDLTKANRILVGPGRISILVFPEPVAEAKVGAPDRLKVVTSTTDPKELTIFWVQRGAYETNLIVRTVRRVFVFDIVPSLSRHQDFVRVRGAYSGRLSPLRVLESQSLSPNTSKSAVARAAGGKRK